MLSSLSIKNYAIIESVEIQFDEQLNIITGETGAGKSILLGAMHLILGKRADTSVLRNNNEKCLVEACFKLQSEKLKDFFVVNDIEFDKETIIRREISANGKSRAFINDSPVTLDVLKSLTEQLVDIHAQEETQNLLGKYFFCEILDELAKQSAIVKEYQISFQQYKHKQTRLRHLQEEQIRMQKEFDFISFQLNELVEANIDVDTFEGIENELGLLQNAELIKRNLSDAYNLIDGNDFAALTQLLQANKQIGQLTSYHDVLLEMHDKLSVIIDDIKSMTRQINNIAEATEYNEERVQELLDKQNTVNKLLQKHHVASVNDLLIIQSNLQEQTIAYSNSSDEIIRLENEIKLEHQALLSTAQRVSKNRNEKIKTAESKVSSLLVDLGMPFGHIILEQKNADAEKLNAFGIDEIRLLFSANKGASPQALDEVGSGGEKSRLMLAIKSLVAETITLPTLIFDEIDTGISGEVAQKVGNILRALGTKHQVIAITHLPQVAARANRHFFVYKNHEKEKTFTEIKTLQGNERLHEIAVMLSGNNPPKEALENAKRMLN
ncbi:MAG TPA: DNA repair protein RecN [Chitinophagales bacterium]|nr:DNA repair protein RecN [Chitinophagales bacterium]HMW12633.1 DNA repair protein RecN [Chitinophagales bacterium]HMX59101.1 DNA repair protein RecN [Chitinophagales bacterium]HMZ33294.1 DNA repair protein RecN [Chitinophagales bacterium]HNA38285.1 DNA repair protein RecN [Chitinophagales bacterium]